MPPCSPARYLQLGARSARSSSASSQALLLPAAVTARCKHKERALEAGRKAVPLCWMKTGKEERKKEKKKKRGYRSTRRAPGLPTKPRRCQQTPQLVRCQQRARAARVPPSRAARRQPSSSTAIFSGELSSEGTSLESSRYACSPPECHY